MAKHVTRRKFLRGSLGMLVAACAPIHAAAPESAASSNSLALGEIEKRIGGRLGVYAFDTGSGREVIHRADERFAMCSTFKWVLAAQVLKLSEATRLSLDERIAYGPNDLEEYAPTTREHLGEGSMTVEALAAAIVLLSDNTAANLLLKRLGGPMSFTEYVRSLGDVTTRLDRYEPALNQNELGDVRDTTSPRAMVGLLKTILCGSTLTATSRECLLQWMQLSATGKDRLRAGLPRSWIVGDKTGTGANGACNDVALAIPPNRAPLLMAVYMTHGEVSLAASKAAHADVARVIAGAFTS